MSRIEMQALLYQHLGNSRLKLVGTFDVVRFSARMLAQGRYLKSANQGLLNDVRLIIWDMASSNQFTNSERGGAQGSGQFRSYRGRGRGYRRGSGSSLRGRRADINDEASGEINRAQRKPLNVRPTHCTPFFITFRSTPYFVEQS